MLYTIRYCTINFILCPSVICDYSLRNKVKNRMFCYLRLSNTTYLLILAVECSRCAVRTACDTVCRLSGGRGKLALANMEDTEG